ncbi:MAG: family 43 glycosylhydrolase, partial [Planctomycetaceae bacterium]|nr:family 43 glycosylhydrolase [Planctomycetaceae bacterium]
MTILRCSFLKAVSFLIAAIMLTILFGGNSGSAQTYDAIRDIHYYMMDKNESRELPAVSGRTYLSSDDKIAVIAGNTLKAVADGDCVIEMITGGKKSVFARLAVGWQVQNPVLPYSWGLHIDDSEVHNFNGQMYAYGCMEGFVPKRYASPYYPSLTTRDMKHWESYGYSYSSFDEGSPYPGRILWDADGCFYKGKYLLYGFFEWNASGKDNNSFVMESDSPTGRFKNLRWLIGDKSGEKIDGISAQIFIDSDDSRYILYSPTKNRVEENYIVVARLKDDHIIDEASRKNLGHINDYYENPSLRKHGDMYYLLFAENCGAITNKNHTPKRLSYATSKNIFGPYTYRGVIITVEHLVGNSNIQGCMEPFGDNWYLFYHRSLNAVWNQRTMCIEKIEFDKNGLIKPVVPTSSGISEGLNTSKPIYFNTAVIEKNCRYSNEGKYGSAIIKDNAEIGFRYVSLTGKEKKISLQGKGLNNITTITVTANGKIIGQGIGGQDIKLENIGEGKTELVFNITSNGEVKLETFRFFDYMTDKNDSRELPAAPAVYNGTSKDKPVFRWQKQNGVQCLLTENNTVAGRLSGETSNGVNVVSEKIVELDSTTFQITRQYKAVKDVDSARVCFDFVHASPSAYWMIPAVSYNGNRFGRGKEPKNAAENGVWRSFSFRRTPIPGITYSEGKQFAVAVWSDNPQRECDNFACSLMPEEQTTTHRIILPEEEMPTNYTKVNGSKTGFQKQMAMKKGETLTLTMYVNVNAVEKNHTAVRHFLDKAWAMAAKPKIAIPDADKIWNLAIRYAKESLWKETEKDGKKFSGFDIGLHPDKNGKWIMYQNTYQAGWVGRNIPLANALLADFLRNGNEDSKNKGLKVLDSWAEHCVLPNGLMLVTFRGFPDRSRLQQ